MRCRYFILWLCCTLTTSLHAQDDMPPSLHIGDPAPSLQLREWLKGEPVERFEKGRVAAQQQAIDALKSKKKPRHAWL